MNVILQGVVGSQAYGLDTPDSDVDRLGIYAVDTAELFKLDQPPLHKKSIVTHQPDLTLHEVDKFCRLARRCNPGVLELLWLGSYEQQTSLGYSLIVIRNHFLSATAVKGAYLGYANEQMMRLNSTKSSLEHEQKRRKVSKHARHVARLLYQGYQLYRTATLPVRLPNAVQIREIGEAAGDGHLGPLRRFFNDYEARFNISPSSLPDGPDTQVIDNWLYEARMSYLPGHADPPLRQPRLRNFFTDYLP